MTEYQFDFESGNLCLDFSNTSDWHASENPDESLDSLEAMIAWGEAARLLDAQKAAPLYQLIQDDPEAARIALERAIELREAIYRLFSSRYHKRQISTEELRKLNAYVQQAMAHLELVPSEAGFDWCLVDEIRDIGLVLYPVARAAADLLTSEQVGRVRECEDDRGCGYLFIDQSKNQSRRWCSMDSCGNRAKARRHYARLTQQTGRQPEA